MAQTYEVVYENNVFRPLKKVRGIREHQKAVVILYKKAAAKSLKSLIGTMSRKESAAMQALIEGEW
jgi:predicted DNA-binding antitoxin AbrB/MazE fold protein